MSTALDRLEELNQRVWGQRVALATFAHFAAGIGVGLLLPRTTAERLRPLAFGLLGFSTLTHLYAWVGAVLEAERVPVNV